MELKHIIRASLLAILLPASSVGLAQMDQGPNNDSVLPVSTHSPAATIQPMSSMQRTPASQAVHTTTVQLEETIPTTTMPVSTHTNANINTASTETNSNAAAPKNSVTQQPAATYLYLPKARGVRVAAKKAESKKSSTNNTASTTKAHKKIDQPKTTTVITNASTTGTKTSGGNPNWLGSHLGLGPHSRIHINGFLSAGGSSTDAMGSSRYNIPGHGAVGNKWNFGVNSLVGLQITGDITHNLSAILQFVASGDDTNGNKAYQVKVDWGYLRYFITHNLQVRAGRFRIPLFLYSNTQQVGYSYPWVFLPNEVYRLVPFFNINGVDLIYNIPLGQTGWTVSLQPYFGANTSEFDMYTSNPLIPQGTTAKFNEDDIIGFVGSVSNPYITIRGTYVHIKLTGRIHNFVVPPGAPAPLVPGTTITLPLLTNRPASFLSFGGKFNWHHIVAAAEWAQRKTPAPIAALTGYYGMIGYHIHKFLPTFTYAHIKTTNIAALAAAGGETPQAQRSFTLGLNYYINSNLVVKGTVSQITPLNGTNGLFTSNPGKRHIYLYGISLDAIF